MTKKVREPLCCCCQSQITDRPTQGASETRAQPTAGADQSTCIAGDERDVQKSGLPNTSHRNPDLIELLRNATLSRLQTETARSNGTPSSTESITQELTVNEELTKTTELAESLELQEPDEELPVTAIEITPKEGVIEEDGIKEEDEDDIQEFLQGTGDMNDVMSQQGKYTWCRNV